MNPRPYLTLELDFDECELAGGGGGGVGAIISSAPEMAKTVVGIQDPITGLVKTAEKMGGPAAGSIAAKSIGMIFGQGGGRRTAGQDMSPAEFAAYNKKMEERRKALEEHYKFLFSRDPDRPKGADIFRGMYHEPLDLESFDQLEIGYI